MRFPPRSPVPAFRPIRHRRASLAAVCPLSLLAALWLVGMLTHAQAQRAVLDPTFHSFVSAQTSQFALQADGTLLVLGSHTDPTEGSTSFLVRLRADGTLDPGFRADLEELPDSFLPLPDGKILLGGVRLRTATGECKGLRRLHRGGALDRDFDLGARFAATETIPALVGLPEGRVLLGGGSVNADRPPWCRLLRLNPDGGLDASFDVQLLGQGGNEPLSIAVQDDSKILVAGNFHTLAGYPCRRLGRLHPDGTFDSVFTVATDRCVWSLTLQADGKVVVGGDFTTLAGHPCQGIGRLLPQGEPDPGFAVKLPTEQPVHLMGTGFQTDGRVLLAGWYVSPYYAQLSWLDRRDPNGTADESFACELDRQLRSTLEGFAIQPDGHLLAATRFAFPWGGSEIRLQRLLNPDAAAQSLIRGTSTVTWLRDGASPEIRHVTFDYSADGLQWRSLGAGARVPGGWQLGGLDLPSGGTLRARGQTIASARQAAGWIESMVGAPAISFPPDSLVRDAGADAAFRVWAGGTPPLAYQWQYHGTNLPSATASRLELANLSSLLAGGYRVIVSNGLGSVTSAVATLEVRYAPPTVRLKDPPVSPHLWPGDGILFQAIAAGAPYPSLQWQLDGRDLPGQTNLWLTLTGLGTNQTGGYTVVAVSEMGSCTSAPVQLTVSYRPPSISQVSYNFGATSVLLGNGATFYVGLAGSEPLSLQWWFNGEPLAGETHATLSVPEVRPEHAGLYWLTASNLAGVAQSEQATLTVARQAPSFITQPRDQTVTEGGTIYLDGFALAGPPAAHTLRFNGAVLPVPQTYHNYGGRFALLDVTSADAGQYDILASNAQGVARSRLAQVTVLPAGPLDRWTQRNPLPQSQRILSLAHDGRTWVAVGENGALLTSTDAVAWSVHRRQVESPLRAVLWAANQFVATGTEGLIFTSPDGTNWTCRHSDLNARLGGVAYGNGRYVVAGSTAGRYTVAGSPGSQTCYLTSPDGLMWRKSFLAGGMAESSVAWGNGVFVAVGTDAIATSTNGLDWRLAAQGMESELNGVKYCQNRFFAYGEQGQLLVSPDGEFWTGRKTKTAQRLLDLTFGNGTYVVTGTRGLVLTSTDTLNWTPRVSGTPDRLETVHFADGGFVAAGENGTTLTSAEGTQWTRRNRGVTRDLDGLALANGLLVVVGKGGTILTSTDGALFTPQDAGVSADLHGVAWGDGLWVAVGEPGAILTSPNGVEWTSRSLGLTNALKSASYGNGRWVVVGTEGAVITSADGERWRVEAGVPGLDLNDTAYGNGRYVIVGDGLQNRNGSSFVSPDTREWAFVPPGDQDWKNLRGLLFAHGTFLVAANDNYLLQSIEGSSWSSFQVPMDVFNPAVNLRGVAWAQGRWIVVGNEGCVLSSSDLRLWQRHPCPTVENLHDAVYLKGRLVVIGNRGTVLQSDPMLSELQAGKFLPGEGFSFTVRGWAGRRYLVQTSPDLRSWSNLGVVTNSTDSTRFVDPEAPGDSSRYYRLAEPFAD